jgi:hypothetical protein
VPVPPVIINRINYHPSASFEFPDAEDLEFIELLNNSNQSVDMTGLYFGGTGFVYQFPVGAVLSPNSSVYLASNIGAFRAKYGFTPYGKFTRHLSNKGEDLVLLDAFGNIVDNVTYSDTIPWPDADGNGSYLLLKDPLYDNSLAENWMATTDIIVSDRTISAEARLLLYPNPVSGILNIQSESEILGLKLFDIYGHELLTMPSGGNNFVLDMTAFPKGIYIIRIILDNGSVTEKIIRD